MKQVVLKTVIVIDGVVAHTITQTDYSETIAEWNADGVFLNDHEICDYIREEEGY